MNSVGSAHPDNAAISGFNVKQGARHGKKMFGGFTESGNLGLIEVWSPTRKSSGVRADHADIVQRQAASGHTTNAPNWQTNLTAGSVQLPVASLTTIRISSCTTSRSQFIPDGSGGANEGQSISNGQFCKLRRELDNAIVLPEILDRRWFCTARPNDLGTMKRNHFGRQ